MGTFPWDIAFMVFVMLSFVTYIIFAILTLDD